MKAISNRLRRLVDPTRTLGKSALQRNPQGRAFGRGERKRQPRLDRKHPQNLVLKPKLHERLRIIGLPKKPGLTLHSRVAKTKPLQPRRKINLKRNWRGRCRGV